MRHITLDRTSDGRFSVRVLSGAKGDATKVFATYGEADAFAMSKMGRAGMVIDTTTMTAEQLAKHRARSKR